MKIWHSVLLTVIVLFIFLVTLSLYIQYRNVVEKNSNTNTQNLN